MPLIEELPESPSSYYGGNNNVASRDTASKAAAEAAKAKGFDLARALKGAGSSSSSRSRKNGGRGVEQEESACHSRGDGKYENGTHFTKVRMANGTEAMQIGPNAFAPDEAEETMKQLQAMGAFGNKGKEGAQPSAKPNTATTAMPKAGPMPPPPAPQQTRTAAANQQNKPAMGPSETSSPFDFQKMASWLHGEQQANKSDVEISQERVRALDDQLDDTENSRGGGSTFALGTLTPDFEVSRDDAARTLTVEVVMPNASGPADVDLDVTKDELRITPAASAPRDARYRLKAKLPAKVVPDSARAKWVKSKKKLKITLALLASAPPTTTAKTTKPAVPAPLSKAEALRGRGVVDYAKFDAIDPDCD